MTLVASCTSKYAQKEISWLWWIQQNSQQRESKESPAMSTIMQETLPNGNFTRALFNTSNTPTSREILKKIQLYNL